MPLFKDSHLARCITESLHNLLLPIATSVTVEQTLEEDKQALLFTHKGIHNLGYNCPIKSNQWPHS